MAQLFILIVLILMVIGLAMLLRFVVSGNFKPFLYYCLFLLALVVGFYFLGYLI